MDMSTESSALFRTFSQIGQELITLIRYIYSIIFSCNFVKYDTIGNSKHMCMLTVDASALHFIIL